ncbi:hypothetical protein F8M41_022450 [Gigaspora margarita]|uniref:Uncharacterized protein n=1 Tax=Gigaspora margarita TaxID=4874 RepID=A0A8H4EHY5_GIGMA|nr:hypothetical protein F8M41_022450 [Gigaspora margarita]
MKYIYFLIIFIFTLQIYSTVHAYQHPLAILWEIQNGQVIYYLKREEVLAITETSVSTIIETIGKDAFGGIYADIKMNKLTVNIKDPSLENSLLLDKYRDCLLFNIVNRSLDELKVQFVVTIRDAKRFGMSDHYIYIDIEVNDVITRPNLPPGPNTQPFGPRKHVPIRPRQVNPKVLGGAGIFNRNMKHKGIVIRKTCSIGFYAHGKNSRPENNPPSYIITTRSCYIKDSNLSNYLYIRNWGANSSQVKDLKGIGIRNTDDPSDSELFITDARPATIIGGHICHSGFGTHVTCGNIKALTAIYLNEDGSSSKGLIITDMNTRYEDIGGTVFFYKLPELRYVDLFGILVILGSNLAAALPSNIILENTDLVLYKL